MNIIIDDTLIFFDEDENSGSPHENSSSLASRSAQWFVELGGKIFKGLDSGVHQDLEEIINEKDNLTDMDAYFVQVGPAFDPRPFGLQHLTQRIPYSNPKKLAHRLSSAAERGWLEEMTGQQYFVSTCGRSLRDRLVELAERSYAEIDALPSDDLTRLDIMLSKVVDAALKVELPEEKVGLNWSRKFDFGEEKSMMSQVRRKLVDLFAFRDDAHVAAWKAHEDKGYLWEAFTYVWNDEANTAAELAERLIYRGYSESDYKSALEELAARGWLTEVGGIYKATPAGRALREAVEEQTNQYFDRPWSSLSETEFEELRGLMEKFEQRLHVEQVKI